MFNLDKKTMALIIGAAASTVIAGIIHLIMGPRSLEREFLEGIFFLISGAAQVFWAWPTIKRWNKLWYFVGIGGTAVLIALWFVPRMIGLAEGRGLRISENALIIEIFQIAFIVLCIMILKKKTAEKLITVK